MLDAALYIVGYFTGLALCLGLYIALAWRFVKGPVTTAGGLFAVVGGFPLGIVLGSYLADSAWLYKLEVPPSAELRWQEGVLESFERFQPHSDDPFVCEARLRGDRLVYRLDPCPYEAAPREPAAGHPAALRVLIAPPRPEEEEFFGLRVDGRTVFDADGLALSWSTYRRRSRRLALSMLAASLALTALGPLWDLWRRRRPQSRS